MNTIHREAVNRSHFFFPSSNIQSWKLSGFVLDLEKKYYARLKRHVAHTYLHHQGIEMIFVYVCITKNVNKFPR